jgi:pimeloyl-ACP methyl ester carboxylesterase
LDIEKRSITLNPEADHSADHHANYQAAYWDVGNGPPILFLHGFMGRAENWRSLVQQLYPDYRCVCVDMLGFGDSSRPPIRYDIATLVAFVHRFANTLGINPCVVTGHSLGGWVASAYALSHPDAVRGLVLAAPAGIRDDSFCGRYDAWRPLLWQTPVVDWALQLATPLAIAFGKQSELNWLRWVRWELNTQPAPRSFLLDRLRPEDAIDTVEKDIHRLQTPTLVIAGERDKTIPLWHAQTYATEIPDAQLVVIPDADHALPQQYAAELADSMLPFLQRMFATTVHHEV